MLYYFLVYMFFQLRLLYATAVCWLLFVAFLIGTRLWGLTSDPDPAQHTTFTFTQNRWLISCGYICLSNFCLMISCYFVEYWLRIDFSRHHLLILEEKKVNELLGTLLPARITEQMKQKLNSNNPQDSLIAETHDNVSILFSDIVGFTSYAASISPNEVVQFLSALYTCLDLLTDKHHVLKVETIGDAYFVASGVLSPRADHACLLANFSFDMLSTLSLFKLKNNQTLRMRIGMHAGKVIAGVVGLKVPRFHLFGESVTIASLMEQTGRAGQIQASMAMAEQLQNFEGYGLELRTEMENAPKMVTYWVTDRRSEHQDVSLSFPSPASPKLQPAMTIEEEEEKDSIEEKEFDRKEQERRKDTLTSNLLPPSSVTSSPSIYSTTISSTSNHNDNNNNNNNNANNNQPPTSATAMIATSSSGFMLSNSSSSSLSTSTKSRASVSISPSPPSSSAAHIPNSSSVAFRSAAGTPGSPRGSTTCYSSAVAVVRRNTLTLSPLYTAPGIDKPNARLNSVQEDNETKTNGVEFESKYNQ